MPDKPYSYCKTNLGCQAQNVLAEAFQLHNRWRFVQDSLVHFRGQISLLKMTITFFTRATSSVFLSYTTKHEKFGIHFYTTEKTLVCMLRLWMQVNRMILITPDICKLMRLLQEMINKLLSFQTFSKIHKLVPECSL